MSDQRNRTPYQPPVAALLTIGEGHLTDSKDWPDYPKTYGLTAADSPELIRMMTDDHLWESEEYLEGWGVVHAWRALGQLKVVEAIAPLLSLWDRHRDDDWLSNEAPWVIQLIGMDALPVLIDALANTALNEWARCAVAEGVSKIGRTAPEHRDICVETLTHQLEAYNENTPILNGILVATLLDLQAIEAVDVIGQAYAADQVDDMIPGTWATVQIELGLKKESDFAPKDLQPRFFKNMQAARLIANPEFEEPFDQPLSDWDFPSPSSSPPDSNFLDIPRQASLKPVQGFGQGVSSSTKSNKKKKKK